MITRRITLVGDIMLGDSAARVGFGGGAVLRGQRIADDRARIARLIAGRNPVMGNLETVLSNSSTGATSWHRTQMRTAPSLAEELRNQGFSALAIANNHMMQHGKRAAQDTIACLRDAGLGVIGQAGRVPGECLPFVISIGGQDLTVLGYSLRPQQYNLATPPVYAQGDPETIVSQVRDMSVSGSPLIVSLHWGEEFTQVPSEEEVRLAHRIIDAGASVLWGHHPHVVRPIERYADGLIAYSLGNFISDMNWDPCVGSGAMITIDLAAPSPCHSVTAVALDASEDFVAVPGEHIACVEASATPLGLAMSSYAEDCLRTVSAHRRRTYLFALRNLLRYKPRVLAALALQTVRNRLHTTSAMLLG